MATRLYREYKFKFYLNANHYIIINGKNGQTHPHTWEFVFYIMKSEGEFVLFNKFEKDRKSTRLNSSHGAKSRMPSSA